MMDPRYPTVPPAQPVPRPNPMQPYYPVYQPPAYPQQQPQIFYVPVSTHRQVPWSCLSVIAASAVALGSFFFFPFVDGLDVSLTGVQIVSILPDARGLWFLVLAVAIAGVIAGGCALTSPNRPLVSASVGGLIAVFGVLGCVPLYVIYSDINQSALATFFGSGFWLCGIACMGVIISGILVACGM